ncbi:conjugative transposon protein TraM [Sphingobacterium bovistauri]|uniref:Conjugative transposon protein TraM n=1 Tax=Sphingobacterium bovistauri TaxID=2781959 RepID=A0ABS7Z229_9SPHI|nr:conjugative transposon protein TraM [Sphingobacterium bovistauri]MCA5004038.1 conjugative transposon protein TraM [Sphingobacterium bovistauri]
MKVNFKKPRYIIPLIAFPFLCIFYYVLGDFFQEEKTNDKQTETLQVNISEVSDEIKKRELADKLAAYKNQYKYADGYTAISEIKQDQQAEFKFDELYNENEKRKLDSIEKSLSSLQFSYNTKQQYVPKSEDQELQNILNNLPYKSATPQEETHTKPMDPLDLFRKQMALADSFAKANDPEFIKNEENIQTANSTAAIIQQPSTLSVEKFATTKNVFNTIKSGEQLSLIKAIIDENRTSYADSRLRLRLLEDLRIGEHKIDKGTFLYAKVSGFTAQRVQLTIQSIMHMDQILPVKLDIYDQDGQAGLFVPESQFREFGREISGNSTQGITINQQAENNSQLLMSTLQRMFQSTSTAINKHIRKNKAKIKYNTHVYLFDASSKNTSK